MDGPAIAHPTPRERWSSAGAKPARGSAVRAKAPGSQSNRDEVGAHPTRAGWPWGSGARGARRLSEWRMNGSMPECAIAVVHGGQARPLGKIVWLFGSAHRRWVLPRTHLAAVCQWRTRGRYFKQGTARQRHYPDVGGGSRCFPLRHAGAYRARASASGSRAARGSLDRRRRLRYS